MFKVKASNIKLFFAKCKIAELAIYQKASQVANGSKRRRLGGRYRINVHCFYRHLARCWGSVSTVNSLCVVEPGCPPEFVIVLKPCDVKEGEKAEFSCQVTGNPPPEVTWLFDGQPLQGKGQYALLTKNKLQVGGDEHVTDRVCVRVCCTRDASPSVDM